MSQGTFSQPSTSPPSMPGPNLTPDRGAMVLTLGILGIVICFVCGIVAWVLANKDLREMDMGRMNSAGRGLTTAGKICGMVATIIACIGLIGGIIWMFFVIAVVGGAAAAAAGASGR